MILSAVQAKIRLMKPYLLRIEVAPEHSFKVRNNVNPLNYNQWHYHEELELTWIQKGSGIRFVGDNVENFVEGDLILLGSNLPHYWRSDEALKQEGGVQTCQAVVVQFKPDFWGTAFLELPELSTISDLFAQAKRGLRISGTAGRKVCVLIQKLISSSGLKRILLLLNILQAIQSASETSYISSIGFNASLNDVETKRISAIYGYTITHFKSKIKLEEIAAVANLTPTAFCRYFRSHTNKTYSQFLLEIRVGHACKLLMDAKMSIGQICMESGFQNFSNFNRYFKSVVKLTPLEYQKIHG